MRGTRHLGFVAAAATLLAAAPLSAIFAHWTWLIECFIIVALVAGAAALARWLRAPLWLQVLGMLCALLLGLTWIFPSGDELLVALPTPDTLLYFAQLASRSMNDMQSYGVEVPDTPPLLFITVLGVGGVAIVVDLLAVGLRRPALAGLPMLAIYSVPVAVYPNSVPALPFIVGAIGFLWLLVADNVDRVRRFGRRFTGEGRDVDVWEPSPLAAAGRRLSVVGVALAVLLPVVVPGMSTGLLDRYGAVGTGDGNGSGRGGPTNRIDLFASLKGQLRNNETTDLVTVKTNETNPFYLRFGVADELQSDGFRVRTPGDGRQLRELPDPQKEGLSYNRFQAQVKTTGNYVLPLLPTYGEPVSIKNVDSGWAYDEKQQVVYSTRRSPAGKKEYTFEYVRPQLTQQILRDAPSTPQNSDFFRQFTKLPNEEVPKVQQLVDNLTNKKTTDYDKVLAIYSYFSRDNNFQYSTATETGTSGQDIVDFLDNKVGFCQQYAAAMAWMVRAAKIPARVAFGFTNGTNYRDGTYTLTNKNLHAWTEVYFDAIGWVPFDATPAADVGGSARSDWAPDVDAPDPLTPSSAATVPGGVKASAGPAGPERPDHELDPGADFAGGAVAETSPRWPWWTALGVLLALVLLALPATRRAVLRRRRHSGAVSARRPSALVGADAPPGVAHVVVNGAEADRVRAEAHAAWDELIDTLVDLRLRVDPTETPRATAERLVRDGLAGGSAAEHTRLLGLAEERARYARDPQPNDQLGTALHAVRRALAAGVSRRIRLVAAVLPPSVLQRWRLSTMDASSRSVVAVSQVRNRLLGRFSPRRLFAGRPAR